MTKIDNDVMKMITPIKRRFHRPRMQQCRSNLTIQLLNRNSKQPQTNLEELVSKGEKKEASKEKHKLSRSWTQFLGKGLYLFEL